MSSLRATQKEFSARTREAILATLRDTGEDWLSSQEIAAGLTSIEDLNPARVGGLMRLLRDEGLVENRAERNYNVWRLKTNGQASSTGWRVAPKPDPGHPWKLQACHPSEPAASVSCELPMHLTSPKPESCDPHQADPIQALEKAIDDRDLAIEPASGTGDFLIANPPLAAILPTADISLEDEAPALTRASHGQAMAGAEPHVDEDDRHPCAGACRQNDRQANELIRYQRARIDGLIHANAHLTEELRQLQAKRQEAREALIRLLLAIADEATALGESLSENPIWRQARHMAPHFNLEASYA